MSMTPEEKFNQQVWEILQDIKGEFLATVKGKPVKYRIVNVVGAGITPKHKRIKILYKLEEEKVFKIQKNARGVRIGTGDIFYLIVDPQKFDEVYKKFQKACDINSYLNDYQQKAFKGKKLPKFSQVKQEETKKKAKDSTALPRENTPEGKKTTPTKERELIKCCGLTYSLQTNKLSYGKKNGTYVSPETREMKFFLALFRKMGNTVDYKDIAKSLDTRNYKYLSDDGKVPQEELLNKDFSEDSYLLKRDFRKLVLSLGMPPEEFSKMIKTIKKKGYQLVCR